MRLVQEHHPATISLTKPQFALPSLPSLFQPQITSPGLARTNGWKVKITLILRNLFGSCICACGTEEHYLRLCLDRSLLIWPRLNSSTSASPTPILMSSSIRYSRDSLAARFCQTFSIAELVSKPSILEVKSLITVVLE
jgi:hypothetical protein